MIITPDLLVRKRNSCQKLVYLGYAGDQNLGISYLAYSGRVFENLAKKI